jgi:hypothetical protein
VIDPVLRDLDRHLDALDDDDRLESQAEEIRLAYTAQEAKEIIDDYFADNGGDDLIKIMGELAAAESGVPRSLAISRLSDRLDEITLAAALITAKKRANEYDP